MKIITKLVLTAFVGLLLVSCSGGKRMDDPGLMKELQGQINDVVSQGYQIDDVVVYSKNYSDEGPDSVGDFKFMFINAVSPDTSIKYMANFSYSGDSGSELRFHGYPVSSTNKVRTGVVYNSQPDLPHAISKLDEIKKMIPKGFEYDSLLTVRYRSATDAAYYDFKVEVRPSSDGLTHPNVRQEKRSYVKHTTTRTRKKFGTTQEKHNTDTKRKIEHTITFRLKDDRLEIK